MKELSNALWNRINRLLPRSHDPTLVLLKGHLLLEEQLFAYIAAHCASPTKLEEARLSFAQKLKLAQSLSRGSIGLLAKSCEKLNTLRNKMAHHAEVSDLDSRIDDYLRTWAGDQFVPAKTLRERSRHLRNTLIYQIGLLSGMADEARLQRPNSE